MALRPLCSPLVIWMVSPGLIQAVYLRLARSFNGSTKPCQFFFAGLDRSLDPLQLPARDDVDQRSDLGLVKGDDQFFETPQKGRLSFQTSSERLVRVKRQAMASFKTYSASAPVISRGLRPNCLSTVWMKRCAQRGVLNSWLRSKGSSPGSAST